MRRRGEHCRRVRVLSCALVSCEGDEDGCNSSGCHDMSWTWMTHEDFVEMFGRCPRVCTAGEVADGDNGRQTDEI